MSKTKKKIEHVSRSEATKHENKPLVQRQDFDETNKSDTLFMTVEDLISSSFGSTVENIVDYKLVQTILHILARQMRLLGQHVQIRDTRKEGRSDSVPSISISEVEHTSKKVLVVEKGPTTHTDASRTRVGSIQVVTLSQFAILEDAVNELKQKTGPIPSVSLPDNEKLRADIAKGSASLTDTMQAMQVNARVDAAEQAIDRMSELLTQLAAAGALSQDLVADVSSVNITAEPEGHGVVNVINVTEPPKSYVTHTELDDAVQVMMTSLMKNIKNMTSGANTTADKALNTAKSVAEKMEDVINMNKRISTLYSLVSDYSEQLSGFDAGLVSSMQSFNEQMIQLQQELKNGLNVLTQANASGETAAVKEMAERCDSLTTNLEQTMQAHQDLITLQDQLGNELKSLVEYVELLREQKSDRDEMVDSLRDKADVSRLSGLLQEEKFAIARQHLEDTLNMCHDKFQQQDAVWMNAIKDLSGLTDEKADILELIGQKNYIERQLRELDEKMYQLALKLGEPKAALLTRVLSRGARCCVCGESALMESHDVSSDAPPLLPALHPPPAPPLSPLPSPCRPTSDTHVCHRWVGGSHTLVSVRGGVVTREQAPHTDLEAFRPPTVRFAGYGKDGRLYMMEKELQPCEECNKLGTGVEGASETAADGAGDRAPRTSTVLIQ